MTADNTDITDASRSGRRLGPLLSFEGASLRSADGRRLLLRNLDLQAAAGESLLAVGAPGAGHRALAAILCGEPARLESGRVLVAAGTGGRLQPWQAGTMAAIALTPATADTGTSLPALARASLAVLSAAAPRASGGGGLLARLLSGLVASAPSAAPHSGDGSERRLIGLLAHPALVSLFDSGFDHASLPALSALAALLASLAWGATLVVAEAEVMRPLLSAAPGGGVSLAYAALARDCALLLLADLDGSTHNGAIRLPADYGRVGRLLRFDGPAMLADDSPAAFPELFG